MLVPDVHAYAYCNMGMNMDTAPGLARLACLV